MQDGQSFAKEIGRCFAIAVLLQKPTHDITNQINNDPTIYSKAARNARFASTLSRLQSAAGITPKCVGRQHYINKVASTPPLLH
jgi:hypothetical protein